MTDDELRELAYSAHEEAMSFGLSHDTFLRYFKTIRARARTPLAVDGASPSDADRAVFEQLGIAMYGMTTTVHSPNIPFAEACALIPALWQHCMEERDAALSAAPGVADGPIQKTGDQGHVTGAADGGGTAEAPERAPINFRLALNVKHPSCHEAADAFWQYWNDNGETHRHGYYESTWGAINRAIRMVGVIEHDYGLPETPATESKGGA